MHMYQTAKSPWYSIMQCLIPCVGSALHISYHSSPVLCQQYFWHHCTQESDAFCQQSAEAGCTAHNPWYHSSTIQAFHGSHQLCPYSIHTECPRPLSFVRLPRCKQQSGCAYAHMRKHPSSHTSRSPPPPLRIARHTSLHITSVSPPKLTWTSTPGHICMWPGALLTSTLTSACVSYMANRCLSQCLSHAYLVLIQTHFAHAA